MTTERDADGNVVLQPHFQQVAVMPGCTCVTDDEAQYIVTFFKTELNTRIQYLETIVTKPDRTEFGTVIEGTGGRHDTLIAIHQDDLRDFSVKRFQLGEATPRWIEDMFANGHGELWDERVAKYKCWEA